MTLTPPVAITIRAGAHEARVPLVALAAVFHVAPVDVHAKLAALVEGIHNRLEGEPTEGESDRSIDSERDIDSLRSIDRSGFAREGQARLSAEAVACALGDEAGVAAIRRLVEGAPPELVELALTRTLAVPAERIVRSRAAYFSTVLCGLRQVPPRSSSRPYA